MVATLSNKGGSTMARLSKKQRLAKKRAKRAARETRRIENLLNQATRSLDTAPKKYKPQSLDSLQRIQETLSFIKSQPNLNKDDRLSKWMMQAMREVVGDDHEFQAGDSNSYFTIDPSWDGDEASLISHVTWHQIPNERAEERLLDITNSKWGSEQRHDEYLDDAQHKSYRTHIENLGLDAEDQSMTEQLESLMHSSTMWKFIGDQYMLGTKYYESEQADEDWEIMYRYLSDMVTKGRGKIKQRDIDKVITYLNNPSRYSVDDVVNYIDETLKGYIKG